jgi:hypothetical protein
MAPASQSSPRLVLGRRSLARAPLDFCHGLLRIIYYWAKSLDRILMLLIYSKTERENLTPGQVKILRKIVEEGYS